MHSNLGHGSGAYNLRFPAIDRLLPILLAPFIGSFLGVLIRRLPQGRPVALARSACESCGTVLRARDLVPLASYAWHRGSCARCHAPIGRFHPTVELSATAVAAVVVTSHPVTGIEGIASLWVDCGLAWCLLALAWIDAEHRRLPDVLTLSLIVAGLTATLWLEPWWLLNHVVGAIAGYAAFRAVSLAYKALRRREGLGHGDAKLLAAAGAWLGWNALPAVVVIAAILAITFMLLRSNRNLQASVAFGPFLAGAILILRLFRELYL